VVSYEQYLLNKFRIKLISSFTDYGASLTDESISLNRRFRSIFRSRFLGPLVIISHVLTISCNSNIVYTSCSFVYRILPVIRPCKQMVCPLSFNKSGLVRHRPVLVKNPVGFDRSRSWPLLHITIRYIDLMHCIISRIWGKFSRKYYQPKLNRKKSASRISADKVCQPATNAKIFWLAGLMSVTNAGIFLSIR
jgi:hypothetical protein